MTGRVLNECLCCGSKALVKYLDLGIQPLANNFVSLEEPKPEAFPLELVRCESCWHSQLSFIVDRDFIFDHYLYVSGTSKTLQSYFDWLAVTLSKVLGPSAKVLELAANDGSLVEALLGRGIDAIGLDPAANVVNIAKEKGLPIKVGYWPEVESAFEGSFDLILCLNVLAHVDKPLSFLHACRKKLSHGGAVLIQTSQARMFEFGQFDTCYHEHVSFFNLNSIRVLAEKAGLTLIGGCITQIHGDSQVFVLSNEAQSGLGHSILEGLAVGSFAVCETLDDLERRIAVYAKPTYESFASDANNLIALFRTTIDFYRDEGFAVAFVGAAAKGITFLNAAGITGDYFLDEAELKIGKLVPGMNLLVSSLDFVATVNNKTLFVITAWNFSDELLLKLKNFGVPKGSRFLTYFPDFRISS